MRPNIPCFWPLIEAEEKAAAVAALELGWLGMGSLVAEFEATVGRELNADNRHVVAVNTGHSALHLGLLLAGVGPGDEVITPSFNNPSDFQAVLATGAALVFCDIDPTTLCIDVNKAEQLITPRTKLLLVLDYGMHLCDHNAIADLARRHRLRVLHDAAHSIGSDYKGRKVGSFSDMTMFSFDPIKSLTAIDAGILVVDNREDVKKLQSLRLLGMGQPSDVLYSNTRAKSYEIDTIGFRYHLANSHAAIGLAQLKKFEMIKANRRNYCRRYQSAWTGLPWLELPVADYDSVTPFMYYVRVPADCRDDFRAHLAEAKIETGVHWRPGHTFAMFRDARRGDLSVTERIAGEIVTIPLHSVMPSETQQRVIDSVCSFVPRQNPKSVPGRLQ